MTWAALDTNRRSGLSANQLKIHEIQEEIRALKVKDGRAAPKTSRDAVKQLQDLGLVPMGVPTDNLSLPAQGPSKDEWKKIGMTVEPGKPDVLHITQTCSNCSTSEKSNLKSGKYVKSNINIKVQEQWPHMCHSDSTAMTFLYWKHWYIKCPGLLGLNTAL